MVAVLLAAVVLPSGAEVAAQDSSRTSYPVEEGFGSGPVTIEARLFRPTGALPAPAVIVLHGCRGPTDATFDWARRIAGWGYVTIVPDSFGSRDKVDVCNDPMVMLPGIRVPDVIAAADYLATRPFVQRARIGLIGFSHGAGTVIEALQHDLSALGIRGGIAYYPLCIPETQANVAMPLLVVIGDKDDWSPAARCRALQQAGLRHPDLAEFVYYPAAHHGFDYDAPPQFVSGADLAALDGGVGEVVRHHIEYDPDAARDAELRTRVLLDKLLR